MTLLTMMPRPARPLLGCKEEEELDLPALRAGPGDPVRDDRLGHRVWAAVPGGAEPAAP